MADHLCDPRFSREYGAWRVYVLDVLLSTDQRVLAGEVEKLDPEALVSTGVAVASASSPIFMAALRGGAVR